MTLILPQIGGFYAPAGTGVLVCDVQADLTSQATYTFTPPTAPAGATRLVCMYFGRTLFATETTHNGVAVTELLDYSNNNDGYGAWESDELTGNVVIGTSGATLRMLVAFFWISNTGTLVCSDGFPILGGSPRILAPAVATGIFGRGTSEPVLSLTGSPKDQYVTDVTSFWIYAAGNGVGQSLDTSAAGNNAFMQITET
jgi:hypothetical protein